MPPKPDKSRKDEKPPKELDDALRTILAASPPSLKMKGPKVPLSAFTADCSADCIDGEDPSLGPPAPGSRL